ncbi:carbohydrate binding family 9 domain-containing protein [Pseudoalteromonas sp. S16_S37]|uniref:carbohydrate binding family 9 domain-containing protein n=1 Tax=Pseudoalteromonas sp. S16_S37 TaxID=2720228 RepID=UPI00168078DC|nr:carbohydrate binding family 9 domain-containing protein [Pseudoalteromonas sp. S16_S37]MBD1583605.1 carbohydrate binding family 9 domain-containing protein [Pseudoalteromonas sp. S16_S37]
MIRKVILALSTLVAVNAIADEQAEPLPFISTNAIIDGKLDEPVWQQAKKIAINNVTWPQENIPSPVSTTAYVYENGTSLFVAYRANDPTPELIRAFYKDRDRVWNDDLVGLKIDSFNSGRSAYQFFINPLGVQLDSIENELTKSEDSSWNGIWDSAGTIDDQGYTVEIEIPLRVLNFDDSKQVKNMAMEFLRFLPRDQRLRLSNMQISHANSCWICQMPEYSGFAKAKQGNNIAIIPSLVLSKSQTRDIDGSEVPDWQDDDKSEPGLDVKWAITPDTTINATLNPDFSQVEADTGQLSVNNSFSLFFPEKRAFFLDNADYFSSHLNLIHTRNIAAPDYGIKLSGNKLGHTYGVFVTNDEQLNVLVPGNLGSSVISLEQKSDNVALRYRYDVNDGLSIGSSATIRDSKDYKNQLISFDTKYKPTTSDTFKVQLLRSNTQYSQAFADELCDGDDGDCAQLPATECVQGEDCDFNEGVLRTLNQDDLDGLGYFLNYEHNTKHWRTFTSYQSYDEGLRADMGFMSQVDFNKFLAGFEYRWYGEQDNWWNRARWYTDWDITHNDDGALLEKEIQTNVAIDGPLQSFIDFGVEHRKRTGLRHNKASLKIDNNSDLFSENTLWTYMEFKPVSGLFAGLNLRTGNKVDLANNRVGQMRFARPVINLNLGKHFEVNFRHSYETLNADGAQVYTANLTDVRLTYQFNINSYLRIAVIHTDIDRNIENYIDDVDAQYKSLSTQLLYSYKLNPQTVFFAGYADKGYQDDDLSKLTKDEKTFFAKFSYAWLM